MEMQRAFVVTVMIEKQEGFMRRTGYRTQLIGAWSKEAAIGYMMEEQQRLNPDATICNPAAFEVTMNRIRDIGVKQLVETESD